MHFMVECAYPYDIQPLNILFLQNGYREKSYARLVTASVLYYRKSFTTLADACLYQLIKVIQEVNDPEVLTAIEAECLDYLPENLTSENSQTNARIKSYTDAIVLNKRRNVGFNIEGCIDPLSKTYKVVGLGSSVSFSDLGTEARNILLNAIKLRREINSLEQEIADQAGEQAKKALREKQRAARKAERIAQNKWANAAQANKDELDEEANAALNQNATPARKWTAVYVKSFDSWETINPVGNIFTNLGNQTEWSFAKILQIVCDDPQQIGEAQEATVKRIIKTVVLRMLQSQETLIQLTSTGKDELAKATFIHMVARIIRELVPQEEIPAITYYTKNWSLKINGVNLLKMYIEAYALPTAPPIDETTWTAIERASINSQFVAKLKKLYNRS